MKITKRILEVKIIHATDMDPDTSYYGKYSNRPESDFAIDRATDEFQQDIDNGRDMLERVTSRLEDEYNEETSEDWIAAIDASFDTLNEIKDSEPFANVSFNRREFRYFNPNDSNYQGERAEDIRKYCRQDYERMEAYNRQQWNYVGVYATAEVQVTLPSDEVSGRDPVQTIRSGGLWGTESDSDRSHFEQIEQEQLSELRDQLKAFGFSARAISTAFKQVVRGEE